MMDRSTATAGSAFSTAVDQPTPLRLRIAELRERIARRTLTRYHASPDVRILQVALSGGSLIVASDDNRYGVGVDVYRLPSADDTDPDQADPVALRSWQSVAELGVSGLDEVEALMARGLAVAASYDWYATRAG